MLDFLRYFLAVIFLLAGIYFGIEGFRASLHEPFSQQSHKVRAIRCTIALLCALISFELYYPTFVSLICFPLFLISIWMEYLIATMQINRFRKK